MKLLDSSDDKEVIQGYYIVGNILFGWEGKSHCKPEKATLGQAAAIAQKFIKNKPEYWHEPAPGLIGAAFQSVWSCPTKQ